MPFNKKTIHTCTVVGHDDDNNHVENQSNDGENYDLWLKIQDEAKSDKSDVEHEPVLSTYDYTSVLSHNLLGSALTNHLSIKLNNLSLSNTMLFNLFIRVLTEGAEIVRAVNEYLRAVKDRLCLCELCALLVEFQRVSGLSSSQSCTHALFTREENHYSAYSKQSIGGPSGSEDQMVKLGILSSRIGFSFPPINLVKFLTTLVLGDTSFNTTEPAPILPPSPILMFPKIQFLAPIKTSSPISGANHRRTFRPITEGLFGATQCHIMQYRHIVSDHSHLSVHKSSGMIEQYPTSDLRSRMDIHRQNLRYSVLNRQKHVCNSVSLTSRKPFEPIQNRVSEVLAMDIHPGTKIRCGILLDHATRLVNGEMAVIRNNVSILHNVTLGGTEKAFSDRPMVTTVNEDLRALKEGDPKCVSYAHCLLIFKEFLARQAHRVAHKLWSQGRKAIALLIQNRVLEVFTMDIHLGAKIGRGILLDHATRLVIEEMAVIGNNVSILHNVTLGGTGKSSGNIKIGDGGKIGAGSVVLKDVSPRTSVVKNLTRLIGGKENPIRLDKIPSLTPDQTSHINGWSHSVI
ncbi:hypothetical protein Ddye_027992 [Dipteronia dyeriana]|uniref:Serine acetyltransferase N-terminal domain-containing protein n=1 Tax=Dipteronia dyeriana TaxID=168575 RepID=A0AAD9TQL7_9ROSI|nr:hypothetical protein Ddye_027992 [Dipteronia dyeriana]